MIQLIFTILFFSSTLNNSSESCFSKPLESFPSWVEKTNSGVKIALLDSSFKDHLKTTQFFLDNLEAYQDFQLKYDAQVSVQEISQDLISFEKAFKKAVKDGNKIINYSLADTFSSKREEKMLTNLLNENDVLLVVAAGNASTSKPFFPCAYPHPKIICVGAGKNLYSLGVNKDKYSNYGSQVDFYASGNGYSKVGTSFAAPKVSASLALIWAYNPQLSALEVVNKLKAISGDFVYSPDVARELQKEELFGFKFIKPKNTLYQELAIK